MNFNFLERSACFNLSDFQVAQVVENINTKRIVLTLQSTRHGSRGAGRFILFLFPFLIFSIYESPMCLFLCA